MILVQEGMTSFAIREIAALSSLGFLEGDGVTAAQQGFLGGW